MTGGLYIQAISASFTLDDTGTGGAASMFFKTRGANAWQLNVAGDFDNGSFQFIRFNPLGTAVDVPLHIHRLTGRVTVGAGAGAVIAGPTTVQGILTANAAINMLGDLGITKVLPRIVLDRSDNSNAGINGRRSGVDRWQVDFGETSGDSSTATGSDFVWHRFNNAGAYMGAAMRLDRPSATLTISGIVQPTGYICRAGTGGGTSNVFNIYWSSPNAPLYIDNSLMGNLTYSSDYRVKENVIDLTTMVDRVKALRAVGLHRARASGDADRDGGHRREGCRGHHPEPEPLDGDRSADQGAAGDDRARRGAGERALITCSGAARDREADCEAVPRVEEAASPRPPSWRSRSRRCRCRVAAARAAPARHSRAGPCSATRLASAAPGTRQEDASVPGPSCRQPGRHR
jgi:hypothetical protein